LCSQGKLEIIVERPRFYASTTNPAQGFTELSSIKFLSTSERQRER
ncbi:unnamed protein product, partial [Linum tenue]